ncbi:killer cell immunoglobulin-like receptor 3DL1 [Peromyscus eremicus]|uniref:killer cell immunoglobulin-like receptor 3DL1 n=1 Tax=Peromyscus eremicus TaxID=42410 RepID=UPI0027DDC149|nr:killer cell immunoglobulin-like receptor 3DL1 [Peromyscus eremicus]
MEKEEENVRHGRGDEVEWKDQQKVVQRSLYKKPSLSALMGPVVMSGENVTLSCISDHQFDMFHLAREGMSQGHGLPTVQSHSGTLQAKFLLSPVMQKGNYRCYGYFSNSFQVWSSPGIYRKPFLLALQTPLVNLGEKVTLECHSKIMFESFTLTSHEKGTIKDFLQLSAENHLGRSQANFKIGPVTPDHAGTYTCYGSYNHSPYEWSESSDPVDIKITGLYKKPSLSAMVGPVVMSGENMNLSCVSDLQFDIFHLSREGVPQGHGLPAVQSHSGTFQAKFLLGPVIQKGNYRCYGSFGNSSLVWSSASDPWYLPESDNHRNLNTLIGLSVTMILVVLIIILRCYCCSGIKRKSQEQASECPLSSVRNQDQRNTAIMDQESEVRATLNRQDSERQEVQEVAYLKFDQMIFKQKLTTPNSQIPKEFSTNPSVYMEVRK